MPCSKCSLRRLDDIQIRADGKARTTGGKVENPVFLPGQSEMRWGNFKNASPEVMFTIVGNEVFPCLRNLGDGTTYSEHDLHRLRRRPRRGRRDRSASATPGTDFERFPSKAEAYFRLHLDKLALQRLRRNKQLTPGDLSELEGMLVDAGAGPVDLVWANDHIGGLGIFIRGLVCSVSAEPAI